MAYPAMNNPAEIEFAEQPRNVRAYRTLLAGSFAAADGPGRLLLEGMLATRAGSRAHHIVPGCRERCEIEQAETQLARDAVDIVVLDLNGSVEATLSRVRRLRAVASQSVIFVGILSHHATAAARLYLSAVVDEVVDGPLRAGNLHRAIADALQDASDFQGGFGGGSMAAASQMRH